MKNKKNIFIFVVFSLLLGNLTALDWQGYGNMSSSNLTDIWTFINKTIGSNLFSHQEQYATNISNHLNGLWDQAWNVYLIRTNYSSDAVLYGYAFRNHWMWYNGLKIFNYFLSFIIWKDFNCQNWGFAKYATGFSQQELGDLQDVVGTLSSLDRADIWMVAKKFMNALVQKPNFSSSTKAYSLVITQAKDIDGFGGRVCLVENKHYRNTMTLKNDEYAFYSIFQTRG